jgi:hypothetical protein
MPNITEIVAPPSGSGYWLLDFNGKIYDYGPATAHYGDTYYMPKNEQACDMAATPSGKGYWIVFEDGGIFTFGDAGFYGSTGNLKGWVVRDMAATPSGHGYWLVDETNAIGRFGNAPNLSPYGSGNFSDPKMSIAATPSGAGFWTVSLRGFVRAYGDADWHGHPFE